MAYNHGIKTSQQATSVSTPVVTASGIPIVIGTAPVHTVGGKANELVLANSYSEAVEALGYSDDWDKYTLCEMIYSQFMLYGMSPVIFVNVLDSSKHKKDVAATEMTISDGIIELPYEALKDTVVVSSAASGGTSYAEDEDYSVYYGDTALIIEINEEGAMKSAENAFVSYSTIDTSTVTKKEIIGGYDITSGKNTGLELVADCYAKYQVIPDIILVPGYSSDPEVAAVMDAKTSINEMFKAIALIDGDCETVTKYTDVSEWKNSNNITSKDQILCWPMCTLGDKKFHMSTILAGTMAATDSDNDDCPSESPSNKTAEIDGLCLADGTEITLNHTQATYLNERGIITCLNFTGGYKIWGNETACYPSNTDVKDYFININRMFGWCEKNFILTFWSKIDKNITRRLIDSIIDSYNIYLNGVTKSEKILGGRIEFNSDENEVTSLMSGKIKFHTFLTPPSPAKEIENTFEYDVDYLTSALEA